MHDACMALALFEQSLCTDGAKAPNKNENTEKNFYYKERVKGTTTKMENSNEKLKQGTVCCQESSSSETISSWAPMHSFLRS